MDKFSPRYKFSNWNAANIPSVSAGVYAIWEKDRLLYCGMSGREYEKAKAGGKNRFGLVTRIQSHASGRLSGDQFCVYVANRLVIPSIQPAQFNLFASGRLSLDQLSKEYINERLEFQYVLVETSSEAYELERLCRNGEILKVKPILNPL